MCVVFVHEELQKNITSGIWSECIATMTKLENIMGSPHKDKCAYENF